MFKRNRQYPSAANYLNMVRTRAGLSNTTATTQKEMSIAIENERMLELCFEGHRWYDLIRGKNYRSNGKTF